MTAVGVQMDPGSPLSYKINDAFNDPVVLQVVGPSGDLTPKMQGYSGGLLTLSIPGGQSMQAYLTQQNCADLLAAFTKFANSGTLT
jgi:hypothetical protein